MPGPALPVDPVALAIVRYYLTEGLRRKNLTLRDLSRLTGVCRIVWVRLITGRHRYPIAKTIRALLNFHKVDPVIIEGVVNGIWHGIPLNFERPDDLVLEDEKEIAETKAAKPWYAHNVPISYIEGVHIRNANLKLEKEAKKHGHSNRGPG